METQGQACKILKFRDQMETQGQKYNIFNLETMWKLNLKLRGKDSCYKNVLFVN